MKNLKQQHHYQQQQFQNQHQQQQLSHHFSFPEEQNPLSHDLQAAQSYQHPQAVIYNEADSQRPVHQESLEHQLQAAANALKRQASKPHPQSNAPAAQVHHNPQLQQQRQAQEPAKSCFLNNERILPAHYQEEDDDTFRKGFSLDDDHDHQQDKAHHLLFGGHLQSQINEDLNKIHKDFAGDTFSQISSTYEYQAKATPQQHQSNGPPAQQVKSQQKTSQSKLYQYKEKLQQPHFKQKHNDELLDSDILNNSGTEPHSPTACGVGNGQSQPDGASWARNQQQMMLFNDGLAGGPCAGAGVQMLSKNNQQQLHQYNSGAYPSPHSNLLLPHGSNNNILGGGGGNLMILGMNSEHMQQSTSTMTIYNSGFFDEASIMRILDKTISDDEDYTRSHAQQTQTTADHSSMVKMSREQSFKFECDDVMSVLGSLNQRLKEKLQKCRTNGSQSQIVTIAIEELKQLEIISTSAVEKVRQLKSSGVKILQSKDFRNAKLKEYKENLKIRIHKQIQKYKELCRKQYKRAESKMFKYQINEFDQNQKLGQLEEKLEKQQMDINRQANACEQMRQQKRAIMSQYDQRISDMESMLQIILKKLRKQQQSSKRDDEKLLAEGESQKISNSFCIGDHSMLLQQPETYKSKYITNSKQISSHMQNFQSVKHHKQQQSVDEKENDSFLSNHREESSGGLGVGYRYGSHKKKQEATGSIQNELLCLKKLIQDIRTIHQQYVAEQQNQQQEGGSMYYYGHDSVQNLLSNLLNLHNDEQQSQFIKPASSQASINQAFIQSQQENSSKLSSEQQQNFKKNKLLKDGNFLLSGFDENDGVGAICGQGAVGNTTLDMSFNQNEILFFEGKRSSYPEEGGEEEEVVAQELHDLMHLDDKISEIDLKRHHHHNEGKIDLGITGGAGASGRFLGDSKKLVIGSKREKLLNQHYQSIGSPDDLNLNEGSIGFNISQRQMMQNSVEDDVQMLDHLCKDQKLEFTGGSGKNNFLGNQSLYSGGSSLINLNYAFNGSKNNGKPPAHNQKGELIVVKVQNREISMPKLDIGRALYCMGQPEIFKNNLKNVLPSQTSKSCSSSNISSSLQHAHHSQDNVGSFINESIPNKKVEGTCGGCSQGGFGEVNMLKVATESDEKILPSESQLQDYEDNQRNLLNQNIIEDQNDSIMESSNRVYKDDDDEKKQKEDFLNMFGSLKEELSQLDKLQSKEEQEVYGQGLTQEKEKQHDDTLDLGSPIIDLDLDGDRSKVEDEGEKPKFLKAEIRDERKASDKSSYGGLDDAALGSIDLINSVFKKSQSDPNLLFNFKDKSARSKELTNRDDDADNKDIQAQKKPQNQLMQKQKKRDQLQSNPGHIQQQQLPQLAQAQHQLQQQSKPVFNFSKIKTPQGVNNQIKIKFNRQSSKEQLQSVQQAIMSQPERQQQIQNLQKKIGISNSRQDSLKNFDSADHVVSSHQQQQSKPVQELPQVQAKKIMRKIKLHQKQQDLTCIEKHADTLHDQSSVLVAGYGEPFKGDGKATNGIGKISFIHESNVNRTVLHASDNNVSTTCYGPDEVAQPVFLQGRKQKLIQKIAKSQKRRDSAMVDEQLQLQQQQQQPKSEDQQQLVQNYFSAAAAMNINTQKGQVKQKRSLAIRKAGGGGLQQDLIQVLAQAQGNGQQQHQSSYHSSQPDAYREGNHHNLIKQLKDFQESYDMEGMMINSNRKVQHQNQKQQMLEKQGLISPSKSQQRTSQSCTPQKRGLIVVSKQVIKRPPGLAKNLIQQQQQVQAQNESRISNNQDEVNITETVTMPTAMPVGQVMKRIAVNKRISSQQNQQQKLIHLQQQNMSVINQSIDQSCIVGGGGGGGNPMINASILVAGNPDNSLMFGFDQIQIQQQTPILNKLQGVKLFKKIISKQQQDQQLNGQQPAIAEAKGEAPAQISNIKNLNLMKQIKVNKLQAAKMPSGSNGGQVSKSMVSGK